LQTVRHTVVHPAPPAPRRARACSPGSLTRLRAARGGRHCSLAEEADHDTRLRARGGRHDRLTRSSACFALVAYSRGSVARARGMTCARLDTSDSNHRQPIVARRARSAPCRGALAALVENAGGPSYYKQRDRPLHTVELVATRRNGLPESKPTLLARRFAAAFARSAAVPRRAEAPGATTRDIARPTDRGTLRSAQFLAELEKWQRPALESPCRSAIVS
jgi:hypothetical protein